jgi:hypothetical protein
MEAFADEGVNEISARCSAQSAKTLTMLCLLAWAIAEDPGPILWVTKSITEARKFAKTRLLPLLERCGPVASKLPTRRGYANTLEIYFPGAPLIITGAESTASLQSTPFRYIFLDEVRNYPPGALEMVSKRTRSYTYNYKKVVISTADEEGDAVDRAFLNGDQRHYEVKCPGCGHFQELRWKAKEDKGGLKWETTATDVVVMKNGEQLEGRIEETPEGELVMRAPDSRDDRSLKLDDIADLRRATKPDGRYNFDRLKETVRYECEACGHRIHDTPTERKFLTSEGNGRWVPHNLNAPSNYRSYTWSALLPWWTSWKDQVVEFLAAKHAMQWNDFVPLKDHINETRGESWTDRLRYAGDEKFIHLRSRLYDPREKWEHEVRRFATIDVQAEGGRHFWLCIRAWALAASSRLLFYGKLWSIEELRQLLAEWNVAPGNVGIDAATFTSEVYKYCVESGYQWKPMKGDDRPAFRVPDGMGHSRTMIYTINRADPAIGTAQQGRVRPLNQWIWSKPAALDRLALFQHGMSGDWQIFAPWEDKAIVGVSDDYALQVTAYERREEYDTRGVRKTKWHQKRRHDHATSCEMMQIVCAAATDILSAPDLPLFEAQISRN